VLGAAEEALRRLQVSGAERNAILDALRYVDGLLERSQRAQADAADSAAAAQSAAAAHAAGEGARGAEPRESKPFTRCGWIYRNP
jgi:hypothetical protein